MGEYIEVSPTHIEVEYAKQLVSFSINVKQDIDAIQVITREGSNPVFYCDNVRNDVTPEYAVTLAPWVSGTLEVRAIKEGRIVDSAVVEVVVKNPYQAPPPPPDPIQMTIFTTTTLIFVLIILSIIVQ